jgi:hypothetical protein
MSKKNTNEDQPWEDQADPVPAGEELPAAGPAPESGTPADDPVPGNQENPEGPNDPGGGENPEGPSDPGSGETPDLPAIEDHAKEHKTPASVFAAVMQMQGWAAGKKVTAEEYREAVETFMGAPMGGGENPGEKSPEGEKQ